MVIDTDYKNLAKKLSSLKQQLLNHQDVIWNNIKTDVADRWGDEIFNDLKLPKPQIKKSIVLKKTMRGKYEISIDSTNVPELETTPKNRSLSIMKFSPKQTKTGVSVNISGSPKTIRRSFLATMPSGHRGIYWRKRIGGGKLSPRLPIREIRWTVSVETIGQEKLDEISTFVNQQFQKEFNKLVKKLTV